MYTKTFLATALAGLSAAVPLVQRAESTAFALIAIHSGSDVQNSGINASGERFWIGKSTSTYCPGVVGSCPNNTDVTAVSFNAGSLGMNTVVPGGQQVYVTSDGQLGYTIAHSASIPQNANTTGFAYTPETEAGTPGSLTFNGNDFVACPTGDAGVYQIYAASLKTDSDCIGIAAAAFNYSGSAAWQYA